MFFSNLFETSVLFFSSKTESITPAFLPLPSCISVIALFCAIIVHAFPFFLFCIHSEAADGRFSLVEWDVGRVKNMYKLYSLKSINVDTVLCMFVQPEKALIIARKNNRSLIGRAPKII